jgi:hypothetical protein
MNAAILSLGLLAAVSSALSDEKAIEVEDLPGAVRAAVEARFPEARPRKAAQEEEDGRLVYEVSLKDGDAEIEVAVSAKGKILEVEKTIAAEKLPRAVAAAIQARHPRARIAKAEEVVAYGEGDDEGKKSYEVRLSIGGEAKKSVELKLSPGGKILDDGDDEDDDDGRQAQKKGQGKKDPKDKD